MAGEGEGVNGWQGGCPRERGLYDSAWPAIPGSIPAPSPSTAAPWACSLCARRVWSDSSDPTSALYELCAPERLVREDRYASRRRSSSTRARRFRWCTERAPRCSTRRLTSATRRCSGSRRAATPSPSIAGGSACGGRWAIGSQRAPREAKLRYAGRSWPNRGGTRLAPRAEPRRPPPDGFGNDGRAAATTALLPVDPAQVRLGDAIARHVRRRRARARLRGPATCARRGGAASPSSLWRGRAGSAGPPRAACRGASRRASGRSSRSSKTGGTSIGSRL